MIMLNKRELMNYLHRTLDIIHYIIIEKNAFMHLYYYVI